MQSQVVFYKQAILTGFGPLPPNFALGYHQCRWNYLTQQETEEVSDKCLEYKIPCDSVWLDIEYTNEKRFFTWDKERFPNPRAMLDKLVSDGRRLVTIIDPHNKKEDGFWQYEDMKNLGIAVKDLNQDDYVTECWPKDSLYFDYLHPKCVDYHRNVYS